MSETSRGELAPPLEYHGKPLTWEPINTSVLILLDGLSGGFTKFVELDPGDATRYELLITWVPHLRTAFRFDEPGDHLLVVRLISGDPIAVSLFGYAVFGGAGRLANGNEWSAVLLNWWLDELLRRLTA